MATVNGKIAWINHHDPSHRNQCLERSNVSNPASSSLSGAWAGGTVSAERPIRRAPGLVDEVYQRIFADLMSLKIPPGSRISVDNLARELGVSQTPIREALSMLEGNGLVLKTRYVGYCAAAKLTRKEFENLYDVRLLLEPYGARHAAREMTDAALNDLVQMNSEMEALQAGEMRATYGRFAQLDAEFHAMIARGSANPLIAESLERLHTHLHIFRLRIHSQVTTEALVEHRAIVQALLTHDETAAEESMRVHIQLSHERLAQYTE
jgi:DNA-binding GntR family transcriptional regulator